VVMVDDPVHSISTFSERTVSFDMIPNRLLAASSVLALHCRHCLTDTHLPANSFIGFFYIFFIRYFLPVIEANEVRR
jgi:hypothetical protein